MIRDISSKSLLFYDESLQTECLGICQYLEIDFLPVIGEFKYAKREKDGYCVKIIPKSLAISEYSRLLDQDVREKLKRAPKNLLFVAEGKTLKGVVHINDFNRNIVSQAIQQDMLVFERNLRQWYLLNDVKNDDIRTFFEYSAKKYPKKEYWRNELAAYRIKEENGELKKHGELQLFTLSQLLDFGNSTVSNKLFLTNDTKESKLDKKDPRTVIIELRNIVMHAKDSISIRNELELHKINELQKFYQRVDTFILKYEGLEALIQGHEKQRRAIMLDNASKLNIIGNYYPNAIEFFLQ
ncbi:MAG: hypothetical protein LW630_09430 [Saprospiraceae bacterium]|nr:hypothetical protein [Saprospiraceae bacterium]